jgi:anthranilate/para-aminobenzoate synthase component I
MLQPFLDLFFNSGTVISLDNGRLLVGFGERQWMKEIEDESKPAFYFPDFFLKTQTPWFQQEFCFEVSVASFLEELCRKIDRPCSLKWTPPDSDLFRWGFDDLQERFSSGELCKGVPYVFERTDEILSPALLHHLLVSLFRSALELPLYCYGFWENGEGVLGASPELLYRVEKGGGSKLKTVACAGTLGQHESLEAFKQDPKELDEHRKVVEGICESLSSYGEVRTGAMEILDLGTLVHLLTPIEVESAGEVEYESVVKALHPTPALGAFPKPEGMKWLMAYQEKADRGRYGAPVGYVRGGGDEAAFYVAIRGIQWSGEGMAVGAGCGVVPQSEFENEWDEVQRKIRSVKEVFSLA